MASTSARVSNFEGSPESQHPKEVMKKKDRRLQIVKLVMIALFSLGTVALTIIDVVQTAKTYENKKNLQNKIQLTIETASIIHNLQKERGLTALMLELGMPKSQKYIKKLQKFRQESDRSIRALKEWSFQKFVSSASFLETLQNYRSAIDNNKGTTVHVADVLRSYTAWISEFISLLLRYRESENLEDFAGLVFGYEMVIFSKEELGLERALGGLHFVEGENFSAANLTFYNEKRSRAHAYLSRAFSFSSQIRDIYDRLVEERNASTLLKVLEEKRKVLSVGNITKPSDDAAIEWFELMTDYIDLMLEVQIKDGSHIQELVRSKIQITTKWLVSRSLLLCFASIVVPGIIISLVKVQNAFYYYTLSLFTKVGLEQGRTEFLMQENSRHVQNLAARWKSFSEQKPDTRSIEEVQK